MRTNNKSRRRALWLGAGVVAGVAAGAMLTQTLATRGQTPVLFSGGRLAHAATGNALRSVADVAERSLTSVVNISTTRSRNVRSPYMKHPLFREFFRRFGPGGPQPRRAHSLGSGVIVSQDGVVITNNHVVKDASKIRVTLSDKREFAARVVGTDPKSDLAVLKLAGASKLHPIKLGDSDKMRLGDVVLAIGNPFGVGQTVTMGIVSAKVRANVGIVDYEDFIQTDAAINPGNSGGAMINLRGELVGINTAILSRTGGYQGIGFAIPSNMVKPIMNSLLKRGRVVRGWLGVVIQDVTPELARALRLPTRKGVLISDVDPAGPARKAGFRRGDLVVRLDGKRVDSTGRLRNLVAAAGAGARVKVQLYRGKRLRTIQDKLAELPDNPRARAQRPGSGSGPTRKLGMDVGPITDMARKKYNIPSRVKHGVVVNRVIPSSVAAMAGIRTGDVILAANRAKITSVRRFHNILRAARGQLLLLVYRQGSTLYMILRQ